MAQYKIECRIEGRLITKTIECREMTIEGYSYCFWAGEYGKTNKLLWAFPVSRTVVEGIKS